MAHSAAGISAAMAAEIDTIGADHFDRSISLLLEAIERQRQTQVEVTARAIREVATDPAVIAQVIDLIASAAQDRATRAAGQGVWWLLKSAVSRWLVIAAIVLVVSKAAGADAAKSVGKWLMEVSG